jgi:flagellar M-ring protein FliF
MATDVKKIVEQSKKFWKDLAPRKRIVLVGGAVGTLVLVAFLATRTTPTSYTTLFTGLSPEDAGEIANELKAEKVDFQLQNGGTSIGVPEGKVAELRIALAQKGIPKGGGVGFEVFDKQSFGATSFVEQMNYRRALQGELQRSIAALDAVEAARVHLAMPEKSLYRNEEEPPTASVLLKLRRGRTLSAPEVRGIVHLVASSIEGLQPDKVTVVDESGRVLSSGDESGDGGTRQHELEQALGRRVESILTPLVGQGHLEVSVTAELDQSQTERTEESYDKDSLALRSETRTLEGSEAGITNALGAGGIAGAQGNLPGAPAPTTGGTQNSVSGLTHLSETKTYEVSKVISRTIGPKEKVKRLHVAVLVDGVQTGKGKTLKVVPRDAKELAQIESLAREAAGIENERGDKIEVHSVPFAAATPFADDADAAKSVWPVSKPIALSALAGLFVFAVLVTFLMMRRARKKRAAAAVSLVPGLPVRVGDLEAGLPGAAAAVEGGVAGANLELPGGRSPRDRVIEAAKTDAARAARVLSAWLNEPTTTEATAGGTK